MAESENKLVLVHHATSPAEAALVRAVLEDAGIPAVIPDSNVPFPGIDLTPFDDEGVAGCEVYVPEKDLKAARRAIKEAREAGRLMSEEAEGKGGSETRG